ncbi:phage regulatory CII family protein [Aliarcobacter cryaerophilus]|uniref:phage regulatory CII family protein n=1 Tax=Aliarcobacter cryaerophilus TaxID=28198 RepID=UPI003BB023B8
MKDYLHNKQSKDSRFLAIFKKAFNKDRLRNGFNVDEAAHEMGISRGTLEQKLKPSAENDITVTEWNHHLELTDDFSTLEYFAQKHGFELKKLDISNTSKNETQINLQADKTMIEFNQAWAKVKTSLIDNQLDRKEKNEALREISEAIKELQQLQHDVEYIPIKE